MIKWVARLAVITALLGLIGTIIIISNIPDKQKTEKAVTAEKKQPVPLKSLKTDTSVVKPQPKKTIPLPPTPVVLEKKETRAPEIIEAPKENVKKTAKPLAPKKEDKKPKKEDKKKTIAAAEETTKTENPTLTAKVQDEKLFSGEELQQLVTRINRTKEENHVYSNCVQIYTTSQSNYKRTIEQVVTYLKSHQFSIAGREVIEKKVKGILISPKDGCIRITIGTF